MSPGPVHDAGWSLYFIAAVLDEGGGTVIGQPSAINIPPQTAG